MFSLNSSPVMTSTPIATSTYGTNTLIKLRVFNNPVLRGQSLKTLYKATAAPPLS